MSEPSFSKISSNFFEIAVGSYREKTYKRVAFCDEKIERNTIQNIQNGNRERGEFNKILWVNWMSVLS